MLIFFLLALVAFVSLSLTICTFQYFQPITSKNYFLLLKLFDTFKSFWSNDCCLVHKKPLLSVFLRSKTFGALHTRMWTCFMNCSLQNLPICYLLSVTCLFSVI